VRHCVDEVAAVLQLEPDRIDTAAPLAGLGFDSLLSLELRRRLELSLGIALPATVAWQFPTIDALVPHLAERMGVELAPSRSEPGAAPAIPAEPDPADLVADLEQMPDHEVEALLLAKMAQLDEGLTR
jgi:polyketide synthase 12